MTFMVQASYTPESWAKMAKNPEDRTAPVKALLEKVGGRLIDMYYCFGEYDVIVICEAPDETTSAGAVLASFAAGHLKASKTTILLTVEQAMEAMGKAGTIIYPAPKG